MVVWQFTTIAWLRSHAQFVAAHCSTHAAPPRTQEEGFLAHKRGPCCCLLRFWHTHTWGATKRCFAFIEMSDYSCRQHVNGLRKIRNRARKAWCRGEGGCCLSRSDVKCSGVRRCHHCVDMNNKKRKVKTNAVTKLEPAAIK